MPLHNAMKEETVPETQTPFEKPICFKLKTPLCHISKVKSNFSATAENHKNKFAVY